MFNYNVHFPSLFSLQKTASNSIILHITIFYFPLYVKVAPYSYLKFRVFYATFGLAKFTTNTLKSKQTDYFEETHNVLNYLWVKKRYSLSVVMATTLICS